MTTETVPVFDQGDRMGKALRRAGVSHGEMADYLGVTTRTVSRWIYSQSVPGVGMLRLWAIRTGVPLEWLQTGEVRHQGLEPRTRWLTAAA